MSVQRISADIQENRRKDCTVIEVPIRPGGVKTVVVVLLGEDGRVHVAGPMNEPRVMVGLLDKARRMVGEQEAAKLVQPAYQLPGTRPRA